MGASAGSAGGYTARNSRRRGPRKVMSDINVTPMVDVMLVLLIVFMVAAPLMTVGIPIDLPKTAAKPLDSQVEPLVISVNRDGNIFLGKEQMSIDALSQKLGELYTAEPDKTINVEGDLAATYDPIAKVLGALNGAGFKKIGLQTSPSDTSSAGAAPAPVDAGKKKQAASP